MSGIVPKASVFAEASGGEATERKGCWDRHTIGPCPGIGAPSGPQLHPDGPCLNTNEYDKALGLLNEVINSNRFQILDNYAAIFAYGNEGNKDY